MTAEHTSAGLTRSAHTPDRTFAAHIGVSGFPGLSSCAPRLYGVHVFDRPADERLSLVEALAVCLDNRSAKPTIVTMVALTKKLPQ